MRASRRHRLVLAALLGAGCATGKLAVDPAARQALPAAVVVLQGSAFESAGARDEATRLVAEATGLPVRVIAQEPAMERVTQPAAARIDPAVATAAREDARDAACRKKARSIATAVAERGAIIVRVRLDARTTARPASDAERRELRERSGAAGVLSAVGIAVGDTVHQATFEGTIERTTFPGQTSTVRRKVHGVDRQLAGRGDAPSVRPGEALARALAALPAARPNRWDAVARTLVTRGCPVLATAVADVWLDGAERRRIRKAAIGALQPASAARDEPTAPVDPDTAAAGPDSPTALDAPPAGTANPVEPTCAALCGLQMVQLCNNDRALWSRHGSRWEATRCGTRRDENFLTDCYRMQWLSGTYDRACIRPCEDAADGRARLVTVLRRAGCLRGRSET
jgi:hypothetical protein